MANASENRSYEERWRQAFEQAEMPPSPNVWKNIDQQLTAQEGGKYKRGFFFYRAVAAGLLLCIAGLGWYTITRSDNANTLTDQQQVGTEQADQIAANRESQLDKPALSTDSDEGSTVTEQSRALATKEQGITEKAEVQNRTSNLSQNTPDEDQSSATLQQPKVNDFSEANQKVLANSSIPILDNEDTAQQPGSVATRQPPSKTLIIPDEEVSLGSSSTPAHHHQIGGVASLPPDVLELLPPTWTENVEKLYLVPQYRSETKQDKEKKGAQFFAGLAMAPSLFDPNFQPQGAPASSLESFDVLGVDNFSASPPSLLANRGTEDYSYNSTSIEEAGLENSASLSFSYGVDIGFTLGKHWSIESGLDFQNFRTETSTPYTVVDVQSGERYPLVPANAVANQATSANVTPIGLPSEVNNQFQFISVPLQIAYNVQVNRFVFSLSPGVAANLFLENRISSDQFASDEIGRGSNSPFNSQYVSGLISGGVFYQLIEHYSLSLTPSYYFALTNLTNDTADFSSQPQTLGLKLGFRYTFE